MEKTNRFCLHPPKNYLSVRPFAPDRISHWRGHSSRLSGWECTATVWWSVDRLGQTDARRVSLWTGQSSNGTNHTNDWWGRTRTNTDRQIDIDWSSEEKECTVKLIWATIQRRTENIGGSRSDGFIFSRLVFVSSCVCGVFLFSNPKRKYTTYQRSDSSYIHVWSCQTRQPIKQTNNWRIASRVSLCFMQKLSNQRHWWLDGCSSLPVASD